MQDNKIKSPFSALSSLKLLSWKVKVKVLFLAPMALQHLEFFYNFHTYTFPYVSKMF